MPLTSYFIKLNYGSFLFTLLFKISAHCSGQVNQEPEIENFHSDIHSEENFSETGEGAPIPLSDEELSQLLFGDLSEMPTEEITISETKVWLHSISASMGLGYSDNPMFGPYTRKSSGFVELGTESFVLRQGNPDYLSYLYFYGEGKRFFDLPEGKLSGLLLVQAEHSYKPKSSNFSFGVKGRHIYFDQAFDFSDLGLPFSMQVQSNKSELIPHIGYRISPKTKLAIEWTQGIDRYDNPSENYRDQKFQGAIESKINDKYTWKGKAFYHVLEYDQRERKDEDGNRLDGTLDTSKIGGSIGLERESELPWMSSIGLRVRYEQLSDNAGAYYDYRKTGAKISHEMKVGEWSSSVELGLTDYQYQVRKVSSGITLDRQSYTVDLQLNRQITPTWKSYLKWGHEHDRSNSPDYQYYSNFWSLGLAWEN